MVGRGQILLVNLIVVLHSQAKESEFCTTQQNKVSKCGKAKLGLHLFALFSCGSIYDIVKLIHLK